jgi:hypothetical protein
MRLAARLQRAFQTGRSELGKTSSPAIGPARSRWLCVRLWAGTHAVFSPHQGMMEPRQHRRIQARPHDLSKLWTSLGFRGRARPRRSRFRGSENAKEPAQTASRPTANHRLPARLRMPLRFGLRRSATIHPQTRFWPFLECEHAKKVRGYLRPQCRERMPLISRKQFAQASRGRESTRDAQRQCRHWKDVHRRRPSSRAGRAHSRSPL